MKITAAFLLSLDWKASPKAANIPLLIFGELAVLLDKKARQAGKDFVSSD